MGAFDLYGKIYGELVSYTIYYYLLSSLSQMHLDPFQQIF